MKFEDIYKAPEKQLEQDDVYYILKSRSNGRYLKGQHYAGTLSEASRYFSYEEAQYEARKYFLKTTAASGPPTICRVTMEIEEIE
jgi:hypothetical protein